MVAVRGSRHQPRRKQRATLWERSVSTRHATNRNRVTSRRRRHRQRDRGYVGSHHRAHLRDKERRQRQRRREWSRIRRRRSHGEHRHNLSEPAVKLRMHRRVKVMRARAVEDDPLVDLRHANETPLASRVSHLVGHIHMWQVGPHPAPKGLVHELLMYHRRRVGNEIKRTATKLLAPLPIAQPHGMLNGQGIQLLAPTTRTQRSTSTWDMHTESRLSDTIACGDVAHREQTLDGMLVTEVVGLLRHVFRAPIRLPRTGRRTPQRGHERVPHLVRLNKSSRRAVLAKHRQLHAGVVIHEHHNVATATIVESTAEGTPRVRVGELPGKSGLDLVPRLRLAL